MWTEELKQVKEQREDGQKRAQEYIDNMAKKYSDGIIAFLTENKGVIFARLAREGKVYSEDLDSLIKQTDNWITMEYTVHKDEIAKKTSKIISQQMGLNCFVSIWYDYDLRKSCENRVHFHLTLI